MAKVRKIAYIREGGPECVMPTQEYIRKVVEDVGEDEDFTLGSWSDIRPTAALRPCNNDHQSCHTTPTIKNLVSFQIPEKAVRIIPGPAGIVQMAKLLRSKDAAGTSCLLLWCVGVMLKSGFLESGGGGGKKKKKKDGDESGACSVHSSAEFPSLRSDIRPTAALRPCNNDHQSCHTTPTIKNLVSFQIPEKAVRIIPGPAGIVQMAKEYIRKVVEDVGEYEDFTRGSWVSAVEFVNAIGGIVSGCLGYIKNFSRIRNLTRLLQYPSRVLRMCCVIPFSLRGVLDIPSPLTIGAALILQHGIPLAGLMVAQNRRVLMGDRHRVLILVDPWQSKGFRIAVRGWVFLAHLLPGWSWMGEAFSFSHRGGLVGINCGVQVLMEVEVGVALVVQAIKIIDDRVAHYGCGFMNLVFTFRL
ncbi:hypothetical protein CTI12_AA034230 [Artemisia annua]|uniref:Uncharacterized protein n=1 Tax=Artemisia annua TaxID=35608 RepID=A0A2U1QG45_ARTAN|nr:hypothetical protein CTI12_AA034230 [Artemisia annua]